MELHEQSLFDIRKKILAKEISAVEVTKYFIKRCQQSKLNAVVEIFYDALGEAEKIDEKIKRGERVGKLAGIPIVIKDNILYKGKKSGCASEFMQDFVAPYSSTVVEKLLKEDAIIIGRTNMDEFAMGGSCENSIYGACHNAHNLDYVAGGSSGGSAVAVAGGLAICAIGTDTGGSIRQPASFNGVVGVKPTYGRVSRYGIVAFASSLDQAGPIAKSVKEAEYVLDIISGKDEHDGTTISDSVYEKLEKNDKKRIKIGICRQILDKFKELSGKSESYSYFSQVLEQMKNIFDFVEIDIPHITNSLACYYILAPAEATSNLARFDGVKYTKRSEGTTNLDSVYIKSRSQGFGKEVKRRIMLGNFVLSSGYFDAYYNKAKKLQRLLKLELNRAFGQCDCLVTPTTLSTAFKIGGKIDDPLSMYMEDLFTVPANLAGIPAISIPYVKSDNNLPLGIQFMARERGEQILFEVAESFEKLIGGGNEQSR